MLSIMGLIVEIDYSQNLDPDRHFIPVNHMQYFFISSIQVYLTSDKLYIYKVCKLISFNI